MKRILALIMIMVMLCGCGGNNGKEEAMDINAYLTGSQDQQAENLMKTIAKALDEKDAELLKSVFSEETKASCRELDRQIEELFEYYEGPTKSYEGYSPFAEGQTSLGRDDDGKLIGNQGYWLISGEYQVYTASEKYRIYFTFYSDHEAEPEKNGIYIMEIITDSLWEEGGGFYHSMRTEQGIFIDR